MTQYLFYFLAFLALFSALLVIFSKNPVYSVLFLVLTFFAIAGEYILLNAQFLAIVHIIVYAGAIMVLFLFVVMLLNLNKETEPQKSILVKLSAVVAGGILLLTLVGSLKGTEFVTPSHIVNNQIGLVQQLGLVLFKDFLLPFEVSSVLFLTAMIGAVMLGKKEGN